MLTGHVNIRTRREMKRMAALFKDNSVDDHDQLKSMVVVIFRDNDGRFAYGTLNGLRPSEERYIKVIFNPIQGSLEHSQQLIAGCGGDTFDLSALWPGGVLPEGTTYYFCVNGLDRDLNIMSPGHGPANTILMAGLNREYSIFNGVQDESVMTVSEILY